MQKPPDLGTVNGRRDAIVQSIGKRPMSLVDICQELNLDGQAERSRMRNALNHLERKKVIVIATDSVGRPKASNNSIVFRMAQAPKRRRAQQTSPNPSTFIAAARSVSAPIVVEHDETASARRSAALSTLLKRVLPGMARWETLDGVAARTKLPMEYVKDAVAFGLHESPPLLSGWTPSNERYTQRLGNKTFYAPRALAENVPPPVVLPPGYDHRLVLAIAATATDWENVRDISRRMGLGQVEAGRLLRADAKLASPTFASWSPTERRPAESYSPYNLFLPVAMVPSVPRPSKAPKRGPKKDAKKAA